MRAAAALRIIAHVPGAFGPRAVGSVSHAHCRLGKHRVSGAGRPTMTTTHRAASSRTPQVSIGVPVYNSERWIETTLASLLAQTFVDFELIISDNASEDGTREICERYASADQRIRYIRNATNIGANRNYLAVLAAARAPYFKWASSNDLCAPEFLERCVVALEQAPDAVLAHPRSAIFIKTPADASPYEHDFALMQDDPGERFIQLIERMQLNNAFNGVMRTALLRRALPMGSFWAADVALMAELALIGKYVLVPERLFLRRMSEETATRLRSPEEVEKHFEPGARKRLMWQNWKYHLRLLRSAVHSAPRGPRRWRAVSYSMRAMVWARASLASDVMQAARRMA